MWCIMVFSVVVFGSRKILILVMLIMFFVVAYSWVCWLVMLCGWFHCDCMQECE